MGYWPKGYDYDSALSPDKRSWRYFSPSTLMSADPGTSEGCMRKLYYEKVLELKGPEQKWQTLGKELHAENESYLKTGIKNMGPLAMAGVHMLPKPMTQDPRLLVEHEIGGGILANVLLRAAGVPVVGFIDCIHWQGTNPGASDVTDTIDPPGTIEVIDWKTTSALDWVKSPQEVSRTLQMTTYGMWAVQVREAEHVRLSHGYYITKGKHTPRKVSLRVHKDQIIERWEYVEHLAGSLIDVVKETNVDKVPANTKACDAFRGCPHQRYCSAYNHNSISSLIGSNFASSLLGLDTSTDKQEYSQGSPMSLLAKLQANTATKPSVQSEMRRLELEEINTKYPGVADSFDQLEAVGLGMPELAGEAARVYAIVKGLEGGATFAGSGELGGFTFTEIPEIMQVLVEARGIIEARGTSLMPAADPVNPFPDDAPPPLASPPEKKEEPVVTVEDALAVAAGEKKTKETKEKKTKAKKADPVVEVPEVEAIDQPTVVAESKAINLFVDCIPSTDYESFWPIVNEVTKTMAREFGGVDYRACDDKSPAGFGKWKGWLANGLRIIKIPGGNYLLDNAMTETGGVIVEAMREIVAESGGMLVRGI